LAPDRPPITIARDRPPSTGRAPTVVVAMRKSRAARGQSRGPVARPSRAGRAPVARRSRARCAPASQTDWLVSSSTALPSPRIAPPQPPIESRPRSGATERDRNRVVRLRSLDRGRSRERRALLRECTASPSASASASSPRVHREFTEWPPRRAAVHLPVTNL